MRKEHSYYIDAMHCIPLCAVVCLMYLLYTLKLTHGDLASYIVIIGMALSVSYAINKTNLFTLTVAFIFTVLINVVLLLHGY